MKDLTAIYRSIETNSPYFFGVLSSYPVPRESQFTINDNSYVVKDVLKVSFRLWYKSGLIKVYYKDKVLSNQARIKQLLLELGFRSIQVFLHAMFRNPVIMDHCGVIDCYVIVFSDRYLSYFST